MMLIRKVEQRVVWLLPTFTMQDAHWCLNPDWLDLMKDRLSLSGWQTIHLLICMATPMLLCSFLVS